MYSIILLQISQPGSAAAADTLKASGNAAANAATTASKAAGPISTEVSIWDMILKGGPIMIPLAILSALAIYFIIERLIVVSKASRMERNFMLTIRDQVLNGNIDSARA